ncbi:MAG: hypothetical protein KHY83_08145 [Coriobacteriia bacterium]|nr:hypothetical protein [Coriobacteriia bacterium]MBS5478619.1 hypothetical protein [Coriobacteriia bacterium]
MARTTSTTLLEAPGHATAAAANASGAAQINVRIDAGLKRRGDAALAAAGLTPSRAVRALWELAESHAAEPESILRAIMPSKACAVEEERAARLRQREEAFARGPRVVEEAYRAAGLSWPAYEDAPSYEKLQERAYEERYGELMGWTS